MRTALLALACLFILLAAVPAMAQTRVMVEAAAPQLRAHVEQIITEAAPRLEDLSGAAPAEIRVVVARDQADFQNRATSLGSPLWAAGMALPSRGLILMRPPRLLAEPSEFRQVLIHELTHLYLAAALGRRRAPLWLEEGLAMYASGDAGVGLAGEMAGAVLTGGLIPFKDLAMRFPAERNQAAVAYAQSYYLISHLLDHHGPQVLRRLLAGLAQGRDLTVAVRLATGSGLASLEAGFIRAMSRRFSWLAVLTGGGVLWGLAALLAGALLVVRRRAQLRARRAESPKAGRGQTARKWPPPPPRADVLKEAGLAQSSPVKSASRPNGGAL